MKKHLIIIVIFFITGCSNGETEPENKLNSPVDKDTNATTQPTVNGEDIEEEIITDKVEDEEDILVEQEEKKMDTKRFTHEEKQEMTQSFYSWAIERAEIGNLAVTTRYFEHGAGGIGDWYAVTPDGQVQVQNQNNPGFDHFDIHAIGGVAFYKPLSEDYGADESAPTVGFAEGYDRLAVPETNIHKYMLADNGVVYELIAKKENMSFSTGFGEYADDGSIGDFRPTVQFEISKDEDAQREWRRILKEAEKNAS